MQELHTRRLAAYAALAVTPLASAEVFHGYGGVATLGNPLSLDFTGGGQTVSIVADFNRTSWTFLSSGPSSSVYGLSAGTSSAGLRMNPASGGVLYVPLLAGDAVTDASPFDDTVTLARRTWSYGWSSSMGSTHTWGWALTTGLIDFGVPAYIGFEFYGDTSTMYGWMQVEVTVGAIEVTAWAYDDSGAMMYAGQVPAPGGLGLVALAMGAAGIRRRRTDG